MPADDASQPQEALFNECSGTVQRNIECGMSPSGRVDRVSSDLTISLTMAGILGVALVYLLQLASPLRLVQDGIDYLLIAESLVQGNGFRFPGEAAIVTECAPGYPALIALLTWVGLGTSRGVVGLNLACLALGLAAGFVICRRVFECELRTAAVITLLTLLSWAVIKHALLPLSDVPYFGWSMLTLLVVSVAERRNTMLLWLGAVLLAVGAIMLRTVGITLVPAVLWAWYKGGGSWTAHGGLTQRAKLARWLMSGGLLVLLGVAVRSLLQTNYVHVVVHELYPMGFLQGFLAACTFRLREFGDLAMNVPFSKAPTALRVIYPFLGSLAVATVLRGGWLRLRNIRAVDVYLGSYILLVFGVAYYDTRYWVPVMPLLMVWAATALSRLWQARRTRWVLRAYMAAFAAVGLGAIGYATQISLAGARFPEIYGDGTLRPAYRAAFGQAELSSPSAQNLNALHVLQRYEPRAIQKER